MQYKFTHINQLFHIRVPWKKIELLTLQCKIDNKKNFSSGQFIVHWVLFKYVLKKQSLFYVNNH